MTRNQLYAIKLVHMLDSGMLCKVVYNCYDDSVLCEFESEKPCVYLIKEDFTDEQAEHAQLYERIRVPRCLYQLVEFNER